MTALRVAVMEDVSAVTVIERASFGDPWSEQSFASLLGNPRIDFRVAEVDGAITGYVITLMVMDEAELTNIAVEPASRGRGLGAALLDAAINAAEANGVRTVHLEVRESNTAARALYASRGFEEVRRRKRYYGKPVEDAVVMRLNTESRMPNAEKGTPD